METKVTYLFGAGASCGTLPLASDLGEDIGLAADDMKKGIMSFYSADPFEYPDDKRPPPTGSYGKPLFEALHWLHATAKNHNSVDTIARKLWMRADADSIQELRKLKAILTAYLWYRQLSKPSDKRYDSFFGTVLQKRNSGPALLPQTMQLLTWNYDLLVERSFFEYCIDYEHVRKVLFDKQGVIHLNGHASVEPPIKDAIVPDDYGKFERAIFLGADDRFRLSFELYDRCMGNHPIGQLQTKIAFAWENNDLIDAASSAASGTTILVIVGYSFPFFNRDADRAIIGAALPSIKTIYMQVNNSVGPKERLLSILRELSPSMRWDNAIRNIKESDYITIPNELIQ